MAAAAVLQKSFASFFRVPQQGILAVRLTGSRVSRPENNDRYPMRIGLKPTYRGPTLREPAGETRCNPQSDFKKIPSLEFQKNLAVPGQLTGTKPRPHERAPDRLSQLQSPVLSSEPHRHKERCAVPRFLIKLSCRP